MDREVRKRSEGFDGRSASAFRHGGAEVKRDVGCDLVWWVVVRAKVA